MNEDREINELIQRWFKIIETYAADEIGDDDEAIAASFLNRLEGPSCRKCHSYDVCQVAKNCCEAMTLGGFGGKQVTSMFISLANNCVIYREAEKQE